MTLNLGIIGLSEGNGHPYSWSAICNGYSECFMKDCNYPVIPKYLSEQKWPDAKIPGVEVTHIWTQDIFLSEHIAKASLIKHVVGFPHEMIGKIDALLLARDDAENHMLYALPFIQAGIPVYIDKPIALSQDGLINLYRYQQYDGQIFTCSALRYAKELQLSELDYDKIGKIQYLQATISKSWEKYSVHIIEVVLNILGVSVSIISSQLKKFNEEARSLLLCFDNGITADVTTLGHNIMAPISVRIYGDKGWHELVFLDSFSAFKLALTDFIDGVLTRTCKSSFEFNRKVVSIIELGLIE